MVFEKELDVLSQKIDEQPADTDPATVAKLEEAKHKIENLEKEASELSGMPSHGVINKAYEYSTSAERRDEIFQVLLDKTFDANEIKNLGEVRMRQLKDITETEHEEYAHTLNPEPAKKPDIYYQPITDSHGNTTGEVQVIINLRNGNTDENTTLVILYMREHDGKVNFKKDSHDFRLYTITTKADWEEGCKTYSQVREEQEKIREERLNAERLRQGEAASKAVKEYRENKDFLVPVPPERTDDDIQDYLTRVDKEKWEETHNFTQRYPGFPSEVTKDFEKEGLLSRIKGLFPHRDEEFVHKSAHAKFLQSEMTSYQLKQAYKHEYAMQGRMTSLHEENERHDKRILKSPKKWEGNEARIEIAEFFKTSYVERFGSYQNQVNEIMTSFGLKVDKLAEEHAEIRDSEEKTELDIQAATALQRAIEKGTGLTVIERHAVWYFYNLAKDKGLTLEQLIDSWGLDLPIDKLLLIVETMDMDKGGKIKSGEKPVTEIKPAEPEKKPETAGPSKAPETSSEPGIPVTHVEPLYDQAAIDEGKAAATAAYNRKKKKPTNAEIEAQELE